MASEQFGKINTINQEKHPLDDIYTEIDIEQIEPKKVNGSDILKETTNSIPKDAFHIEKVNARIREVRERQAELNKLRGFERGGNEVKEEKAELEKELDSLNKEVANNNAWVDEYLGLDKNQANEDTIPTNNEAVIEKPVEVATNPTVESKAEDGRIEILNKLSDKIKEYREKIERTRSIKFITKNKLKKTLGIISSAYQSIYFKRCVESEILYKLLNIDDLIDISVDIMNDNSIRKLDNHESLSDIKYINVKKEKEPVNLDSMNSNTMIQEIRGGEVNTPTVNIEQSKVKNDIVNILEKNEQQGPIEVNGQKLILDKIADKIKELETRKDKTSLIKFKKRSDLSEMIYFLKKTAFNIKTDSAVRPNEQLQKYRLTDELSEIVEDILKEKSIERNIYKRLHKYPNK